MSQLRIAPRKEATTPTRKTILIVCEGERTEPDYFKKFRVAKKVEVCGIGRNTLSLVQDAALRNAKQQYDEVWCVFDRDAFPEKNIRAAFALMAQEKFHAAFSNESFELWYLLHFCYLDTHNTRSQYNEMLSKHLGFEYKKNNPNMLAILEGKQATAIKNAKKLEQLYFVAGLEHSSKPTTSVYKLVERLNKLADKYQL